MLTHALYDESVSRSIVYLAWCCDLTQRASVSMRKCAGLGQFEIRLYRGLQLAQLVAHRHVNPEIAGSSPAGVNFSLFIQNLSKMYPVSFPCCLLHDK